MLVNASKTHMSIHCSIYDLPDLYLSMSLCFILLAVFQVPYHILSLDNLFVNQILLITMSKLPPTKKPAEPWDADTYEKARSLHLSETILKSLPAASRSHQENSHIKLKPDDIAQYVDGTTFHLCLTRISTHGSHQGTPPRPSATASLWPRMPPKQ